MSRQTNNGSRDRTVRLPAKIAVEVSGETRAAIETAAEGDGMPPADWLRRLVGKGIEAARERRERAR
ncbi:MAG: hypothetical protein F4107_05010 [Gemmatimonadetes bacterium]|nr:hypothetical protein [Gemmatimonadota bacterium]MYD13291.1 hypothetical protein [Gemmatimonadota bacterium]MYI65290.1 hypothetical protein [Gemmatimonadota bacterium]